MKNTETTINFIVTDLSILPTANLKWEDNTTTDKSGELLSIKMKYTDLISGGRNTQITYKEIRHYLGGVLNSYLPEVSENTNYQFNLLNGENTFILSLQNNLGDFYDQMRYVKNRFSSSNGRNKSKFFLLK